jgi:hypothetical protein
MAAKLVNVVTIEMPPTIAALAAIDDLRGTDNPNVFKNWNASIHPKADTSNKIRTPGTVASIVQTFFSPDPALPM